MAQASSGDDAGHCLRSALALGLTASQGYAPAAARIMRFDRFDKDKQRGHF